MGVLHPIAPMLSNVAVAGLMLLALAFGVLLMYAYDRGRRS